MKLCKVENISTNFLILPNKEFDPNAYLQNKQTTMLKNYRYNSNIESKNITLGAVDLDLTGRNLALDIVFNYCICSDKSDLPYLKITHTIPNAEIFFDEI